MNRLIRLRDLQNSHPELMDTQLNRINGQTVYGLNNEKIGTAEGALVEETTGRMRYLIIDAGGWFSNKKVLVPVGMATIKNDGIYFSNLTKDQVKMMRDYNDMQNYTYDEQRTEDDRVYAANTDWSAKRDNYYDSPETLQLLEERLVVNKDRYMAGSVEIGKTVETHPQNIDVTLKREEIVVDRHPVDARPVEGVVLGSDSQTIRVDLEAERANVTRQAYVVEEVSIGKNTTTEQKTFSDTVGKEVLQVRENGNLQRGAPQNDARLQQAAEAERLNKNNQPK